MSAHRRSGWTKAFAVVVPLLLVATACGSSSGKSSSKGTSSSTENSAAKKQVRVGMALAGPKNDKGFNQAHYEGLLLAEKELGIKASYQENIADPAARIDAVRNLAQGNDLVIGVGAEFAEAGRTVAPQFPKVEFQIINGQTDKASPNLHVYGVRQGVPAYIAGVLAASGEIPNLKVNKVGYIGGEEIPPTTQSDDGFKAGVAATDPKIQYVSTIVGNFNDAPKAKQAAAAQLTAGANVIFALIDAGFPGIVQAVEEAGNKAHLFAVIYPRCDASPNLVGTAILNSSVLVDRMIKDYINKTIPAQPHFFGVEDTNIQRLELCPKFKTDKLQQLVDKTTAGIVDGSIALPKGV
ncbi:MAG: BMP family protein [Acidimicrobiia bacterium]